MSKKKFVILFLLFLAIICLVNPTFANKSETVIQKINIIANNTQSYNNMFGVENPEEIITIKFEDEVLYNYIKSNNSNKIIEFDDLTYEIKITRGLLSTITSIEIKGREGKKISDLTGIEKFEYLTELKLIGHNITNINEIKALTKLKTLDLSNNQNLNDVTDFFSTSNLSNLQELYINSITDAKTRTIELTGIKNLSNLTKVEATNNGINNIEPLTYLNYLKSLNLASNNISDISKLSNISGLETLNLSSNKSLKDIDTIKYLENLTELWLNENSNIENLMNVLCSTKTVDNKKVYRLINLKNLHLDNVGTYSSMVSQLSNALINLEELYAAGNGITNVTNAYKLSNLHTLSLPDNKIGNKIKDNGAFIKYKIEDETIVIEAQNHIKTLNLSNNGITDIGILSWMRNDITSLNLQSNCIRDVRVIETMPNLIKNKLDLRYQNIEILVKQKTITEQKIILDSIVQNSKQTWSKLYDEDADFTVTGAILNTDNYKYGSQTGNYNTPGIYNIIFSTDLKVGDTATVRISGGQAAGSVIVFKISSASGTDSIVFKDYNLTEAVSSDLNRREEIIYEVKNVPYILNIEYSDITRVTELDLQSKEIQNVKGLESFAKLIELNLTNNEISSDNSKSDINMLKNLTLMQNINLSANKLENADVITDYKNIIKINVSHNQISNLDDFYTWKTNLGTSKSKLAELDVSYNIISELEPIKDITTLTYLNIGNNKTGNIDKIEDLVNLQDLNVSRNDIEDISVLKKLTQLRALNISSNNIKDISSISDLGYLNSLNIANNRITTLKNIERMSNLTELSASDNKIETSEHIKYLDLIKNPDLSYQRLFYGITGEETGTITIELPDLFKEAKEPGSKVYTEQEFTYNHCTISSDGKHIEVNLDALGNNIVYVTIKGGSASGSQFSVAKPINATITYSEENRTKGPVVATITFTDSNREVELINNDGQNTYTFTENGEFIFEYEDEYGFYGTATAKVDWIDNQGPTATVTLDKTEITKENVLVTIAADEECELIEGWTFSEDKKTLTKVYENNTGEAGEEIQLKDDLGNSSKVTIKVTNIDREAPVITGVEEGKIYNTSVQIQITEQNLDTIELTKDGTVVQNYSTDQKIMEDGEYTITVTDKVGHTTTVKFTINITSGLVIEFKDYEEKQELEIKYIQKIKPETTIEQAINNINTNGQVEIYKGETKITDKSLKIATGMVIKISLGQEKKEYKVVVQGDLTQDGKMNDIDLLKLARYKAKIDTKLEGANLKAADIYEDGKYADDKDLLKMARILVGLDELK